MKVLIIDGNQQYHKMFLNAGWEITTNIEEADILQFTGGQDVSPFLYGQPVHPTTYCDPRRDLVESGYFQWGERLGKKMAGICRGGQFLNVMNGGSMYQDIEGHGIHGTHWCRDFTTDKIHEVTSTHHQMMKPGSKAEVIAAGADATDVIDYNGAEFLRIPKLSSNEVLFYPTTNSLCFQPHPEFAGADTTRDYYFELLKRYLGV